MTTIARLYSPDQKRSPKGTPTGGQFASSTTDASDDLDMWIKSLSPDEQEAFSYWTNAGYPGIRAYESNGACVPRIEWYPPDERNSALLNAALARAPKEHLPLYRGIESADSARVAYYSQVGKEISLRALSSFSDNESTASRFTGANTNAIGTVGILLVVPNATATNISQVSEVPEEKEYVMPKGTRFRVKSAQMEKRISWIRTSADSSDMVQGVQPYLRVELEQIQ